jgi:NADPH:quinone reductase-like Zn-dependent oxidoreductase
MKAIVYSRFGPPDVLELREVDKSQAGESDVLVRVRAASVNPADWYVMAGVPYVARPQMGLRKPKTSSVGLDLAGVVAAVGGGVTRFTPGRASRQGRLSSWSEHPRATACSDRWVTSSRSAWRRCEPARELASSSPRRTTRIWWSCRSCLRPER